MSQTVAAGLADLLGSVRRPGSFQVSGTVALLPPSLEVDGVGRIALPLLPVQAEQLVAVAEAAPFGRGEATLVDPAVRRSWQIGPDRVHLGGRHWAATLQTIVERATQGLGIDGPVTAELYKMLVYDAGSFFVGHRDTEKAPGMFGTLLVVLPSLFAGGDLLVRHKGAEARIDLQADDPSEARFAAFYADCVHEVLPVTSGHRLTLVYNLRRNGRGKRPEPPDYAPQQAGVAALLRRWRGDVADAAMAERGPEKLVYLLDHAYTPAEIGFAALKGADAATAQVLAAAAAAAACDAHLALLTIEESGPAEYSDSYNPRRRGGAEQFEVVEISERSLRLSDWRLPEGDAAMPFDLPTDDHEIAPPDACDALAPEEQHFHEDTGNEGASFERTYRRAALVLWPSARKFAVLCQAGLAVTLPYLEALTARWVAEGADTGSPGRDEARGLAAQMIDTWPSRRADHWRPTDGGKGPGEIGRMLAALGRLGEVAEIERLMRDVVAEGWLAARDTAAIVAALGHLSPEAAVAAVASVLEGMAATALAACADLLARLATAWPPERLRQLAPAAVGLVAALPGADDAAALSEPPWRRRSGTQPGCIVDLVTGLQAVDPAVALRAAGHLLAWPVLFGFDAVLIPALRRLVGAAAATPAVQGLRAAAAAHLRARVAEALAPPQDWRRASELPCRCPRCAQLAAFLDSADRQVWQYRTAAPDRNHVEATIKQAGCDLDVSTERRGSPHTLVCTKNQASYERRAAQRRQDLADLALLAD